MFEFERSASFLAREIAFCRIVTPIGKSQNEDNNLVLPHLNVFKLMLSFIGILRL